MAVSVYTNVYGMASLRKPAANRRTAMFVVRLTPGEMARLKTVSRRRRETMADIFRKGANLYVKGSRADQTKR